MKNISLTFVLLFSFFYGFTQGTVQSRESMKSEISKSNNDIKNPKKNIKYKTWLNRAETFLKAAQFSDQSLIKGMAAEGMAGVETLIGKPESIEKEGTKETWIYKTRTLYFDSKILQSWKETKSLDEDAYLKAAVAIFKAEELDVKGKFKNQEYYMKLIARIRDAMINKGVAYYKAKKFKKAYDHVNMGAKLGKFPRVKSDVAFDIGKINLYAGMMGVDAKEYDNAEINLKYCTDNKLEKGMPYHYLSLIYKAKNDSIKSIEIIKEGFQKYPESEQLIIDLVNYYTGIGQTDKVLEYIDMAIKKNPKNPSYYSAKAIIYNHRVDESNKKSYEYLEMALKAKKQAFKNRLDKQKKDKFDKLKLEALGNSGEEEEKSNAAFLKADELYNKAIELDTKSFSSKFNSGLLYYNRADKYNFYATKAFEIFKDADKEAEYKALYKKDMKKALELFKQAYELNKTEKNTILMLKKIYLKLDGITSPDYKKYKEMYDKL